MPQYAVGWKYEEEEKLVDLIVPHPCLYNQLDPSKKNLIQREEVWTGIAKELNKPVDDCKKRWRSMRDSYMRCKRMGKESKYKADINRKLQLLEGFGMDCSDDCEDPISIENETDEMGHQHEQEGTSQEPEVITDNLEYYEITVVEDQPEQKPTIKFFNSKPIAVPEPSKKIGKKNCGRKRSMPMPRNLQPIKILPKPMSMNGPRIVQFVEEPKVKPPLVQEQRVNTMDKLVEKVLKENTNEIDVFFRSMAASVKKLQPSLIPKVKMEVCNVVAKYEMQSFDKI